MVRARILRRGSEYYLELPEDVASPELELFQLREGYYLLSVPPGAPKEKAGKKLSDEEKAVLSKLLRIRFENRVPPYVNKVLSAQEMKVLSGLERRNLVNVFKGRKYKDGVYNIRDDIYPLISGSRPEERPAPAPKASGSGGLYSTLMDQGFVVLRNKGEAMEFSEKTKSEMKTGRIKGTKGFDGKFYVVTNTFLSKASGMILGALEKDMNLDELSGQTSLDKDGCMAVLRLLSESGEVIEKKKGVFSAV